VTVVGTSQRGGGLPARLARVRPLPAFFAALVLVVAGLFLPGIVGAFVLVVLVGAVGYVSALTWRVQPPGARVMRLGVLVLLAMIAVGKLLG
jgi:hypothetical protein